MNTINTYCQKMTLASKNKVGSKKNYLARDSENSEYVSVQKRLQDFTEFTCVYFGLVKFS